MTKKRKSTSTELYSDSIERLMIYRWISALFAREMDADGIHFYSNGAGGDLIKDMAGEQDLNPEAETILEILQKKDESETLHLSLAAEYGFLFHGAGGTSSAPPCESVYTSKSNTLFQEAEENCKNLMESYGLSVSENFSEPADHIAVQAEFMAYLSGLCADASGSQKKEAEKLLKQQRDFLEGHLLNWLPNFAAVCERGKPGGFYASAAKLTEKLLREDMEYLSRAAK